MSRKLTPPGFLVDNPFFRRLFLLRKIYLSKTWGIHYSQFGEDETIRRKFPKGMHGFYVDVGCFHPKKYNNTWQLYKRGWRGINIDIDAIKIEAFNMARPEDTNIACGVSSEAGEIEYYSHGFYSVTTTLDRNFTANKSDYQTRKTNTDTLTALIDRTPYKNRTIDFLSIDCEGHDIEVLKSLDIERYAPALIAIELHAKLFTEVATSEIYEYLLDKGYCLTGWAGFTLMFAGRSLQKTLAKPDSGSTEDPTPNR
jgi:FkbM family methyltransferase